MIGMDNVGGGCSSYAVDRGDEGISGIDILRSGGSVRAVELARVACRNTSHCLSDSAPHIVIPIRTRSTPRPCLYDPVSVVPYVGACAICGEVAVVVIRQCYSVDRGGSVGVRVVGACIGIAPCV